MTKFLLKPGRNGLTESQTMTKPRGFFKRPPGPQAGLWSWRYLDTWKTFVMVNSSRVRGFYEDFPNAAPVGSRFPEIRLATTDGRTINTQDLVGQSHVVVVTGAIT